MNLKTWIPLALAIVLGVIAMKLTRDILSNRATADRPGEKLVNVVVVKRDVGAGASLKASDLAVGRMGSDIPPTSVFRDPAELEGRVIRQALYTGQPVLESLLLPKGSGSGLQAIVPKGMRAITMEINEFSGVAGFLIPGCRVDVVSTINGEAGDTLSRTVVQNIEVTAVGRHQAENNQAEQIKSVTLLVNPKQAEALELAASTGRPRLVLRGNGDDGEANTVGITVAELRGRAQRKQDPWTLPVELFSPRPTPTATPTTKPASVSPVMDYVPPPQRTIRVIKAGRESDVTIELPREQKGSKWMTDANGSP